MQEASFQFMVAVLGAEGARALRKAAEREPSLLSYMLPRAAMAWLRSQEEYEGSVPGNPNSYLQLKKSEAGFSGTISLHDQNLNFEARDDLAVSAMVAVSLGFTPAPYDGRNQLLTRLGKSIDALVKARDLSKKILEPGRGYKISHEHSMMPNGNAVTTIDAHDSTGNLVGQTGFTHGPDHIRAGVVWVDPNHRRRGVASAMYAHAEKATGKKILPSDVQTGEGAALWSGNKKVKQFGKAEIAGGAAPHQGPLEPQVPDAPQAQTTGVAKKPKLPKLPKLGLKPVDPAVPLAPKVPGIKVGKSEADQPCPECGAQRFKANKFVGCWCWKDLSKSIRTTAYGDGFVLEAGPGVDRKAMLAILKDFQNE